MSERRLRKRLAAFDRFRPRSCAEDGIEDWTFRVEDVRALLAEVVALRHRLAAEKPAAPSELKRGANGQPLLLANSGEPPSERAAAVACDLLMNMSRGLPPSEPELREATGTVITRYADGSPAVRVTATPAASFDPTLEPSEPTPVATDVCGTCGGAPSKEPDMPNKVWSRESQAWEPCPDCAGMAR